jgi:hypothetical protein
VAHAPKRRFGSIRRFFKTAHRSDCKVCSLALIGLGLWIGTWPLAVKAEAVDLELILAIDTSISVSRQEFTLQVIGLAHAFRDPRVHAAIRAAGERGIAVSLVQWASHNEQAVMIGWSKVQDPDSAVRLADDIARMPRHFAGYGTAISSALQFCTDLFFGNGFEARRRIIDVSGDGSDNRGPMPSRKRNVAVSLGITINGLAIRNEEPNLDFYYNKHVIGGTGAFVMTANDYLDFADAIVVKLVREISGAPLAGAPHSLEVSHGIAEIPNLMTKY